MPKVRGHEPIDLVDLARLPGGDSALSRLRPNREGRHMGWYAWAELERMDPTEGIRPWAARPLSFLGQGSGLA